MAKPCPVTSSGSPATAGKGSGVGEQSVADGDRFGQELRRLRERAGLTQVQLAHRLGYNHTYLSKLESGARVPRIPFATQADRLLGGDGALLALATHARTGKHPNGAAPVSTGSAVPLPSVAAAARPAGPPLPRRIELPAFGVTCPLHDTGRCSVPVPPAGLADLLAGRTRTPAAETVHGFAALLTVYIATDDKTHHEDLTAPVEQSLRALLELVPAAAGPIAAGLLRLAAQYAGLAGWLRVKRGQHGIGMSWLQRSVEWARAVHQPGVATQALTSMSVLARLEGDPATALEYSRAAEAAAGGRRWIGVQAKLDQARSHALLGDHREFTRLANEARRTAGRLGARDRLEAPWLFDEEGESFIASHLAGALRDLAEVTGDRAAANRAVAFAETSLASLPDRMPPSRLMLTLRLADSHACRGDLDAAIALARPVIAAAASDQTALIREELDRLRTRSNGRVGRLIDQC